MRLRAPRRMTGLFNARSKASLCAATSTLALLLAGAAQAQTQPVSPEHYTLDPNGVDLVTGAFAYGTSEVSIGPANGGLGYGRIYTREPGGQAGWRDLAIGTIVVAGSVYVVSVGGRSESFTKAGSIYTPRSNNGATLTESGNTFTYTAADGAVATFNRYVTDSFYRTQYDHFYGSDIILRSQKAPNGAETTYTFDEGSFCVFFDYYLGECTQYGVALRLATVDNNRGFRLKYNYVSDDPEGNTVGYITVAGVAASNRAYAPAPDSPEVEYTFAPPGYGWAQQGTDQSGRTTSYLYNGTGHLAGVRFPGQTVDDFTVTYNAQGRVASHTGPNGTWAYAYVDSGSTRTTTATGPLGQQRVIVSNLTIGRATSVTTRTSVSPAATSTWSYQYDGQRRLTRTTNPEGDYSEQTYDSRGNVTQVTVIPKSSSGLSPVSTHATYPLTCADPITCNLPTSTTDALGNVTTYTWDSTHGGPLTVTQPAPVGGAIQPQTRFGYTAVSAWYKNSSGVLVAAPPVTLPTTVSTCATGSSPACVGTADEVRTTVTYGASGVANNLLPTTVSQGSGTSPSMAVTTSTYTPNGDVETVDGPLAGAADTTRYRYDDARQMTGVVGPDPDGGGALLNRAQRLTYNPRGQVELVEVGTTPGYTDPNWDSFAGLQRQETVYDTWGRPVRTLQQSSAGVTLALQQVSYDAAGRADCTAMRMNPAVFGSLPASACTPTTTSGYGPDRIVQATFDAAGRTIGTTSGVGTTAAVTEAVTYTANGQPATLVDGNGNTSVLVYDGFDRVSRLRYPDAVCCGTSTTDYDEYVYDAGSNVTSYRNRGGDTFALTYDGLNRLTKNDAPVGTGDVEYAYDNLGRSTCASSSALPTCTNAFTYDALGRRLTETGPLGKMTSVYDAAGRRIQLTWPDGFNVTYDYDLYGAMTEIKQGGSTSLATYAYDDLGRRTGIGRGNSVSTTYGYDALSRLASLAQNPAGTGQDVTLGLGYSPGSQITGRTVSNVAYVPVPPAALTTYTNNGRNQVVGTGAPVNYDGRGNITGALGASYGYDARSELMSAGSASFQYDPLGRLYRSNGAADTRFQYDGVQAATEYDAAGAVVRRHVPGPAMDETVVSYTGPGTTVKTWLLADERGSVIAVTDGSGVASVNTYDEYGVPGSANTGRFQYTGQMWLPEAGLYHYKARTYAPQLGRFMQTDPVGYGAGANLYAYVGNDPVNLIDPLGLFQETDDLPDIVVGGSSVCSDPFISCIIAPIGPSGAGEYVRGPRRFLGLPVRETYWYQPRTCEQARFIYNDLANRRARQDGIDQMVEAASGAAFLAGVAEMIRVDGRVTIEGALKLTRRFGAAVVAAELATALRFVTAVVAVHQFTENWVDREQMAENAADDANRLCGA
jgi:RHS repeat-associated protein